MTLPFGDILRRVQHHTMYELGFDYMGGILTDTYKRFSSKLNEYCSIQGSVHFSNRDCWKFVLHNKDYKLLDYVVLPGENLIKIAKKLWLSEYMLLELNGLKTYHDVKAGQHIKVMNSYAEKMIFYVDKLNFLPLCQQLFDSKGMFAEYKYTNLILNPKIAEEEFTKNFKGYTF